MVDMIDMIDMINMINMIDMIDMIDITLFVSPPSTTRRTVAPFGRPGSSASSPPSPPFPCLFPDPTVKLTQVLSSASGPTFWGQPNTPFNGGSIYYCHPARRGSSRIVLPTTGSFT